MLEKVGKSEEKYKFCEVYERNWENFAVIIRQKSYRRVDQFNRIPNGGWESHLFCAGSLDCGLAESGLY
jgi:hypothetical protein